MNKRKMEKYSDISETEINFFSKIDKILEKILVSHGFKREVKTKVRLEFNKGGYFDYKILKHDVNKIWYRIKQELNKKLPGFKEGSRSHSIRIN